MREKKLPPALSEYLRQDRITRRQRKALHPLPKQRTERATLAAKARWRKDKKE